MPLTISITKPISHCIMNVPANINKLNEVSALPAEYPEKERPTAGCVTDKKIELKINKVM